MKGIIGFLAVVYATVGLSAQVIRDGSCPGRRGNGFNNNEVLNWKRTTKNQFHERGHIEGVLKEVYPSHTNHAHFSVQIGPDETDTIEVIYNEEFGRLDGLQEGAKIKACGDFITSNARAGRYPKSPDDAIIHWVHMNPSDGGHPAGYLEINGTLYGQTYY